MDYAADVIIIILLFTLFSFLHSLLASVKVKLWFKKLFGELIVFYRVLYNIFTLISLYIIYELSPKPGLEIYDLPNPYDIIVSVPQFFALAGIFWAFKYICFREFLGLSQIQRYIKNSYTSELDEDLTLQIEGPYKYTRHPVYFLTIVIFLFRPTMDLFYLTFLVCLVAYFYIGSYFEERKLIRHFGEMYLNYKALVPRIFPRKPFKPYNFSAFAEVEN